MQDYENEISTLQIELASANAVIDGVAELYKDIENAYNFSVLELSNGELSEEEKIQAETTMYVFNTIKKRLEITGLWIYKKEQEDE